MAGVCMPVPTHLVHAVRPLFLGLWPWAWASAPAQMVAVGDTLALRGMTAEAMAVCCYFLLFSPLLLRFRLLHMLARAFTGRPSTANG